MPPKKRDRTQATPTRTLHDFFSKPHGKQSQTTGKKSCNATASSSKRVDDIEVIVIDSDSDSEIEFVETVVNPKRRRLSPRNEPVRRSTVDASALRAEDCTETQLSHSKENKPCFSEADFSTSTLSFGKSTLIIPTNKESPPTSLTFGRSSLVLPLKTNSAVDGLQRDCSPPLIANSGSDNLNQDVWNDGDDEDPSAFKDERLEESELEKLLYEDSSINDFSTSTLDDSETAMEIAQTLVNDVDDLGDVSKQQGPDLWESIPEDEHFSITPPSARKDQPHSGGTNAFSKLMSSFKEKEAWKEAAATEGKPFRPAKANGGRRNAPFYKVLQGMPIAVDAFRYGAIPEVTSYFLTHAHSDHYTNLSASWKHGPIYCSEGTANLIIHMLGVHKKWVKPLPWDTPTEVPNTDGVMVTLIEANHCPGSCLFFFEGKQTVNAGDSNFKSNFIGSPKVFRYLHCGDFRASPKHINHPALKGKHIDHVYLDTTYLDPRYTFPPQPLVISACAELAKRLVTGEKKGPDEKSSFFNSWMPSTTKGKEKAIGRPLVAVGTYSIGKERIVKAIAHALDTKIYCDPRKAAILRCEADTELDEMMTSNPLDALVHLVPLGAVTSDQLKTYLDRFKGSFDKVIGFRPTGWTYSPPAGGDNLPSVASVITKASQKHFTCADLHLSGKSTHNVQLYPVPYSEHSSLSELTCFAVSFNWTRMIATVNVGSESSRAKMAKWVSRWEAEKKRRGKDYVAPYRHPEYW